MNLCCTFPYRLAWKLTYAMAVEMFAGSYAQEVAYAVNEGQGSFDLS